MTQHTLPILGAHFRPPAKAILAVLPGGTKLWLEPEPSNLYDPNAIKINVVTADIPPAVADRLDQLSRPTGFSAEEIFAQPAWHLGYIPREEAEKLVGAVALQFDRDGEVTGKLSFAPNGKPQISFSLRDDEYDEAPAQPF